MAFDGNRAAMQTNQFVDQRQTDAGALQRAAALAFDAMETLEDARNLLLRNADAEIGHDQLGRVRVVRLLQCDMDAAAQRVFECVGDEVEDDPLPHVGIDIDGLGQLAAIDLQARSARSQAERKLLASSAVYDARSVGR